MELTMRTAVEALGAMQGEWDAAVQANLAELRQIRADATRVAEKQDDEVKALEKMREDLAAQTRALGALSEEKRSIEAKEAELRRRYAQLGQRRDAELRGDTPLQGGGVFPGIGVEDVLERAGEGAEKAAVELIRMFGSKKESKPNPEPPADPDED
jgi:hypothetical protein